MERTNERANATQLRQSVGEVDAVFDDGSINFLANGSSVNGGMMDLQENDDVFTRQVMKNNDSYSPMINVISGQFMLQNNQIGDTVVDPQGFNTQHIKCEPGTQWNGGISQQTANQCGMTQITHQVNDIHVGIKQERVSPPVQQCTSPSIILSSGNHFLSNQHEFQDPLPSTSSHSPFRMSGGNDRFDMMHNTDPPLSYLQFMNRTPNFTPANQQRLPTFNGNTSPHNNVSAMPNKVPTPKIHTSFSPGHPISPEHQPHSPHTVTSSSTVTPMSNSSVHQMAPATSPLPMSPVTPVQHSPQTFHTRWSPERGSPLSQTFHARWSPERGSPLSQNCSQSFPVSTATNVHVNTVNPFPQHSASSITPFHILNQFAPNQSINTTEQYNTTAITPQQGIQNYAQSIQNGWSYAAPENSHHETSSCLRVDNLTISNDLSQRRTPPPSYTSAVTSNQTRRSRTTPYTGVRKYNRNNNPDLDRRRIHKCDYASKLSFY